MIRVSTLLKPETLEKVQAEADKNSISVAAIIRQKVEHSYTEIAGLPFLFMGVPIDQIYSNPNHELYKEYKEFLTGNFGLK